MSAPALGSGRPRPGTVRSAVATPAAYWRRGAALGGRRCRPERLDAMSNKGQVRRELVLALCCMSMLIVGLDVTIMNVALPSIQKDFGASVSGAQWPIDAYTLVIACLLMLAGSTGDRLGRRRTFQVGLATFTLGSGLCSIAPGLGWLIAFRMVQAVGGSMLNPVAM